MEGSSCGESGQIGNIPQNPWLNVDRVDWGIFEEQGKKKLERMEAEMQKEKVRRTKWGWEE